jgi:hypothetical protein
LAKAANGVPKAHKIKENHMVMMLSLARRCVEDGELGLAEGVMNT